MHINKATLLFGLLLVFTFLEVLCNTRFLNTDFYVSHGNWPNAIYLICGLVIPLILLNKTPPVDEATRKMNIPVAIIIILGTSIFIVVIMIIGHGIFSRHPMDYHEADMLPKIKVMNERWLRHQDVYAPIMEIWNGLQPNYLPAMWLPYLPAVLFHFDLRMIALGSVFIGLILTIFSISPRLWNWSSVVAIVPFILIVNYTIYRDYFIFSEEGLIAGLYLLLAFAIIENNPWLQGIAICLCLLSRFSFLGWVPLFFLIYFLYAPRKKFVQIGLITLGLTLFLMVSSQAIYNLDVFINLPKFYSGNLSNPKAMEGIPIIVDGLGVAKFLACEQLHWMQTAIIVISLTFPILGWYLYRKLNYTDPRIFLLAMLKIYLVLFYNLLVLPFMYLFYTSTFLSCFILFWYSGNLKTKAGPSAVAGR